MRIKTTFQLIIITSSLFLVNTAITSADDDIIVNISPIIIVDSSQSKNDGKKLLLQQSINTKPEPSTKSLENQNRLQQDQHNPYSLALGANIHINDTLNIGAACGVPLMNNEPVQIEDLSIEAMITMQF